MENNLVLFNFGDQLIRVVNDENGDPWFVAKDVALALDYEWNGSKNIHHVPEEWRGVETVSTPSGDQEMLTLSEPGLYFFLGRSDKPKALPFQKWLAGDVLPALRKTGRYEMPGRRSIAAGRFLKPALRERLLNDALQMARLSGVGDPDAVERIYERYCAIVADPEPQNGAISESERLARLFITDCLVSRPAAWLAAKSVYAAFRRWWLERSSLPVPSQKFFGSLMRLYYGAQKRGGYFSYRDCAFL